MVYRILNMSLIILAGACFVAGCNRTKTEDADKAEQSNLPPTRLDTDTEKNVPTETVAEQPVTDLKPANESTSTDPAKEELASGQPAAEEPLVDISLRLETLSAIDQAVAFLLEQQQEDGSFSKHPGITAMVVIALAESPRNKEGGVQKAITAARSFILSKINAEGAVALSDIRQDVYSTSTCLIALSRLNNPEDKATISNLRKWLIKHHYQKTGAFSYGAHAATNESYPDLSNTHWALEALTLTPGQELAKEYGVLKHKLATFIASCQVVDEDADNAKGGFLYYPIDKQQAKKTYKNLDKVWGSLTMGALKSLLFAGLEPSDPKIAGGLNWTRTNYTMTRNPGLDQGGWYYYIYMFSSAMVFLGQDLITTPDSTVHNWRSELLGELLSRQKSGDHWENTDSKMWMEGNATLCTAYALKATYLALQEQP